MPQVPPLSDATFTYVTRPSNRGSFRFGGVTAGFGMATAPLICALNDIAISTASDRPRPITNFIVRLRLRIDASRRW